MAARAMMAFVRTCGMESDMAATSASARASTSAIVPSGRSRKDLEARMRLRGGIFQGGVEDRLELLRAGIAPLGAPDPLRGRDEGVGADRGIDVPERCEEDFGIPLAQVLDVAQGPQRMQARTVGDRSFQRGNQELRACTSRPQRGLRRPCLANQFARSTSACAISPSSAFGLS